MPFLLTVALFLFSLPALAESVPQTGSSTLDSIDPARTDGVELSFPSGFQCKLGGGSGPSLTLYGDRGVAERLNDPVVGTRIGIALIIPLSPSRAGMCDETLKQQEALSRLEIAEKLFGQGLLSKDDMERVARDIRRDALKLN